MINLSFRKIVPAILFFFSSCAIAEVIQIPLSGMGNVRSSSELNISPALLKNGEVEIGNQKVQEFEITHIGDPIDGPIDILSVSIGGEDSFDFVTNYSGFTSLEAGDEIDFSVTFSPVTLGLKKAFLRIEHSGENSPHLVLLTGMGIDIPASTLQITQTDVDFGSVDTDTNKSKTIKLSNNGGDNYPPVNLYNVVISGANPDSFSTDFNNVVAIAPGDSVDITVTLNSGIAGKKSAQLNIEHDGSNPTIKTKLSGEVKLPPEVNQPSGPAVDPEFLQSELKNAGPKKPTSLQFGPDGKLYVSERDGYIYQYTVARSGKNNYTTTKTVKIDLIQKIQNHDDDGDVNNGVKGRLVTGLLVTGTAANPVIYVASADPRMGGGPSGNDTNLDTNSVILSRLTQNGNNWAKKDLIRGLPRSEENHQGNGMQISNNGNTLYLAMGGHTNMGIPSNNFARLPEYALSAAIVEIDLANIGNNTYDLPTLDDDDRGGVNDNNDPFGGNNGQNMAILEQNGPVQIYSPGYRNAYDVLITESGNMYTVDNGPNTNWGGTPKGDCLNTYSEDKGTTYGDGFHHITNKGYYGGHPNPTRGSKNNTFNDDNPQSPIEGDANGIECQFKIPGKQDDALHVFKASTNGLTEYTSSNFGGAMKGDLLTASFNRTVNRIQLNASGTKITAIDAFFNNLGTPLDVTTQGDNGDFPGTIWVADYGQGGVLVFEPTDY